MIGYRSVITLPGAFLVSNFHDINSEIHLRKFRRLPVCFEGIVPGS